MGTIKAMKLASNARTWDKFYPALHRTLERHVHGSRPCRMCWVKLNNDWIIALKWPTCTRCRLLMASGHFLPYLDSNRLAAESWPEPFFILTNLYFRRRLLVALSITNRQLDQKGAKRPQTSFITGLSF
jgi:hypothetical protein